MKRNCIIYGEPKVQKLAWHLKNPIGSQQALFINKSLFQVFALFVPAGLQMASAMDFDDGT